MFPILGVSLFKPNEAILESKQKVFKLWNDIIETDIKMSFLSIDVCTNSNIAS